MKDIYRQLRGTLIALALLVAASAPAGCGYLAAGAVGGAAGAAVAEEADEDDD